MRLELRRQKYFELSSHIARLESRTLQSLLAQSESNESGTVWGMNHITVIGQSNVFVKRIPVTDVEYSNLFSTKNLYDLPTAYHYGFGSVGLGGFRELITHLKTTHWVLEGEIATFPLMYHHRILPCFGQRELMDTLHGCNQSNVQIYVRDRADANYELVLFLEYIPYVLEPWLQENPNKLENSLNSLYTTIAFLRAQNIIHFDAHFRNILTDGEQLYLTDFGLALDRSFALTQEEETFFEQNTLYDYGEILRNLGHLIRAPYLSCSAHDKRKIAEKYGIQLDSPLYQLGAILLDNIEQIQTDGDMTLDPFYVASIIKYRRIISLMQNFFAEMWGSDKKDIKLPYLELEKLLKETGFLSKLDVPKG